MDVGLFYTSQYRSHLEGLLKLTGAGCKRYGSVAEQFVLVNNIAVCRYLLEPCVEKRKIYSLEFMDVLKKCRSVPVGEEVLSVELCVLYNYMYSTTKSSSTACTTELTDVYNQAYRTFCRVCRLLSQQKKKVDVFQYTNIREASFDVLNNILEKLQYRHGDGSLFLGVCKCVVILAIKEINSGNHAFPQRILEDVNNALRSTEIKSTEQQAVSFPLQLDHSHLHLTQTTDMKEVVSLLKGIYLCRDHAWEKARNVLEKIEIPQVKSLAQFYCGYSLFKCGKYTESVSGLLELTRLGQSLTQRLKARVYNLIGNCFIKLSKHQLAIQMFKEALCVDFSYLVPLYNTSLQYRNQGLEDLELESLNLLVTALSMKENSDSFYDSMDLVWLLKTEDDDISYIQALYTFSNRSLQLKRFDVAVENYMCLLEHLRSGAAETKFLSNIPALIQVYHEAIEALHKCRKYEDCISLCDRVLLCYHSNMPGLNESLLSQTLDMTVENSAVSSQRASGKRKFDDLTQSQDGDHYGDNDVIALKYKAMALFKMGDNSGSLVCLERAIDSITRFRKFQLRQKMKDETLTCSEPEEKRRKLNQTNISNVTGSSASSAKPDTGFSRQTSHSSQDNCDKISVIKDLLRDSGCMLDIEQELYTMTAEVLDCMKLEKDAVHFKQLAKQIGLINS